MNLRKVDLLALDGGTVRVRGWSPPRWESTSWTTGKSTSETGTSTRASSSNVTYTISMMSREARSTVVRLAELTTLVTLLAGRTSESSESGFHRGTISLDVTYVCQPEFRQSGYRQKSM
jgi:hypothetical protein